MKIPSSFLLMQHLLLEHLPNAGKSVANSHWSVGEHIEHSLAVNMSILKGMLDLSRTPVKPITMLGRLVLLFGWMPRGKAKAPEAVKPKNGGNPESIEKLRRICDDFLSRIEHAEKLNGFAHPRLGWLTPEQSFRFMEVHTNHHLNIIG